MQVERTSKPRTTHGLAILTQVGRTKKHRPALQTIATVLIHGLIELRREARDLQAQASQAQYQSEIVDLSTDQSRVDFLRNNLEALAAFKYVAFERTQHYWVVYEDSFIKSKIGPSSPPVVLLLVGRCPVYVLSPGYIPKDLYSMNTYQWGTNPMLDSRHIADGNICNQIRKEFLNSCGMRVHIWGYVQIFYSSSKDFKTEINTPRYGWAAAIGMLNYDLIVVELEHIRNDWIPSDWTPKAVVAGVEYLWERRTLKNKRSIIWRTAPDDLDMRGASGSIL